MQPSRLLCPWDSPGKDTGVGCHFLLQCMKVKSESKVTQSCTTRSYPMDCSPPGFSVHGIFQARVLEWGAISFTLNVFKLSHSPTVEQNDVTYSLIYNKMLNIWCGLLITVLKVKNRMVVWVQNSYKCITYLSSALPSWPGTVALWPAWHHKRVSDCTLLARKR